MDMVQNEFMVIACMLRDPKCAQEVRSNIESEDFTMAANKDLFNNINQVIDEGLIPDIAIMRDRGLSATRFMELEDMTTSAANVTYYCDMLRKDRVSRRMRELVEDMDDASEVMAQMDEEIRALEMQRDSSSTIGEALRGLVKEIREGKAPGINCGFPTVDSYLGGLRNGNLIVIGARPSIGKTALACNMASNISVNHPLVFFSLEMPAQSIASRFLLYEGNIAQNDLPMLIATNQIEKLVDEISARGVRIYDNGANLQKLKLQATMAVNAGAKVVFVDYLTLITSKTYKQRWEQVGEMTRTLKLMARELDVPVVCLSQLGRAAEERMPNLADLRESGSVEQDADSVMFIHRKRGTEFATLNIAKNRHGPIGTVELTFKDNMMKFYEVS